MILHRFLKTTHPDVRAATDSLGRLMQIITDLTASTSSSDYQELYAVQRASSVVFQVFHESHAIRQAQVEWCTLFCQRENDSSS